VVTQKRSENMKVAILAGGVGTRLSEETVGKPKPLVEIGGKPILWHIMMHYYYYGFNEFVIALGYKGDLIVRWMNEYSNLTEDVVIKINTEKITRSNRKKPTQKGWTVNLVDTGQETQTGGRIKRLAHWLDNETFMLTWGDGVSDVNLNELVNFHHSHGRLATLTAVRPPPRFGHLNLQGNIVKQFKEKSPNSEGWINGAYFVLEPTVFDYIEGDKTQFEKEPLERLAKEGQLMAYRHTGFWQCMDTIHEKQLLEKMWQNGRARWKTWEE
jgi:glucose-1-phosphate cytidylyltransferase